MTSLQQLVLKELLNKRIVIETLPISNVRISQYTKMSEHHSFRWMKVPFMAKINDPDVLVSLGSDDPGIFANDICSDFYQLYAVLLKQGMSDTESLQYLKTINERGRQYKFHSNNYW